MPNLFDEALAAEGVTGKLADLAKSIYVQESGGGKNTKTSNQGAVGGMQILPATFKEVADKGWSIDNPLDNARAGIRYLKQLDKQAGGDPALTAAGYYGGPRGLEKARAGVAVSDPKNPKAPNTLQYGAQVVARMGKEAPATVATVAQVPMDTRTSPVVAVDTTTPVAGPQPASADVPVETPTAIFGPDTTVVAAPVSQSQGPDAWQAFLRTLPQAASPSMAAVFQSYGRPMAVSAPQVAAPRVSSIRPNFEAFSSWLGARGRKA